MRTILGADEALIWSGAVSIEAEDGWVMPWRLPFEKLNLFPCKRLHEMAAKPAGVRLRFATDSKYIEFHLASFPGEHANYDLYLDGVLFESRTPCPDTMTLSFENMSRQMKVVELWLYQAAPFQLKKITIDEGASIEKNEDSRPRWITYGSSITHCAGAGSPSFTWPGIVAREKGLNLVSLGFGGECQADPMIARLIRDMAVDIVSVKIGINIYGHSSFSLRSFQSAVIGMLATIRDGHPDIPIIVCSPIWSPDREETLNAAGMTLAMMRNEIRNAVIALTEHGDNNIHYIDGLKLFDSSFSTYLPDQLHPDAEGYKILGRNFINEVFGTGNIKINRRKE